MSTIYIGNRPFPSVLHLKRRDPESPEYRRYTPERTCGQWRGDAQSDACASMAAHENDELWCEHCDIELDESWAYCPHCGARVVVE